MSLVVLTGGARSGKSAAALRLAERRALDCPTVAYAVFGRRDDPEMSARIARHQAERPETFSTLEVELPEALTWLDELNGPDGLEEPGDDPLLVVDCLGTLLGLVMERVWVDAAQTDLADAAADVVPTGVASELDARFDEIVDALVQRAGDTIVVTNEVGMGVVPQWASARLFRDVLGRANRRLIASADRAYLCVAGRLLDLSALQPDPRWPED